MALRFYTDPFKKNAETVVARDVGEWRYIGRAYRKDGNFLTYARDVTYSDGSVQTEIDDRPMDHVVVAGRIDLTTYENAGDGTGSCRHCRRGLADHSGPSMPPDLCPNQPR